MPYVRVGNDIRIRYSNYSTHYPKRTLMKTFAALIFALFTASAFAQTSPACEAKAVSKDGKPLAGAAKNASIKKCQGEIKAACEAKAVSDSGKKLAGAAKNSFMKKCEAEAG